MIDQKLLSDVMAHLEEHHCVLPEEVVVRIIEDLKVEVSFWYVDRLVNQVENILEINPSLSEREILRNLARNVAEYLEAAAVTIRIYNPEKKEMISFGSYPNLEEDREEFIPLEDTIAGWVVKTNQSYFAPDLSREDKYKYNTEKVVRHGFQSMMAVPVSLPRFSIKDVDTKGVLQVYFKEKDKLFTPLEAKIAEVLSRRVSYVIAQKQIIDLQKLNVTKNKIVEQIFLKLGKRQGVKMREVFNLVVPELVHIMQIQRCSLFSVSEDRRKVILEAGYPEKEHGIGKTLSAEAPYLDAIINQPGPFGEFEYEKVFPAYILITDTEKSRLLPPELKGMLESHQINSVLYIPLSVNDQVNYFLAFDAQAHHKRFKDEEIELFTFFGKELMKGLRLEKMDDILHDFKNPAIAVAGFAQRVRRILAAGEYLEKKEKVDQALEVIVTESSRIQELSLSLHGGGREEAVDLTEKLRKRFLINEEAVAELERSNVRLRQGALEPSLWIRCFPLNVERVLDNLLNNASNALPDGGGEISVHSFREGPWAVAEITNTGEIPEEDRGRYLNGESSGRGLHITTRLVKQMAGKLEIESGEGKITFRVKIPSVSAPAEAG